MKRELTAEERERIVRERPWFGADRNRADRDLEVDEAEVIRFSVRRFWDVNECQPPCCPRAFIIQTTDDRFMHIESWRVLPSGNELGQNCVAHRAVASNTLIAFEMTGAMVSVEQASVRDSLFDFETTECEWVDISNLPVEFRRIIGIA